jgi:antitoxin PrlF
MPPVSRLSAKGQTTIPREVRRKLSLRPGDMIFYELDDDGVRLGTQAPLGVACLHAAQSTLSEWASAEDAAAFDDL